jgi:phosphate transport system substrate-binding protein
MMVRWGEEFHKIHPNVNVDVSAGGAGKGMTDVLSGMVDIGMVSREVKPEEITQGAVFVPVVKDAVFAGVSKDNPVLSELMAKGIKKQVFIDLWINEKEMTWGEVAGTSSTEKVQVYTRSDSCGAAETWAKYLVGSNGAQDNLKGVGVYGDPGIAEAVKNDRLGIGYNNLNYAYDSSTGVAVEGLQVVPIDVNGNGKVDAAEEITTKREAIDAILSGAYPSPPARDLYLVVKRSFTGVTKEFVRWILTDGQKYADEVGYINPSSEKLSAALQKVG